MGKKLAIKGHSTRGKEVIELLKMMGGTNPFSINDGEVIGNKETICYYISEDTTTNYISWDYIGPEEIDKYKIFTLEEFLEKYPFKVGDKVVYTKYGDNCDDYPIIIKSMKWMGTTIEYTFNDCVTCLAKDLKMWNGEPYEVISGISLNSYDYADEVELYLGDYEIVVRDGRTFAVKKKPKYPKNSYKCLEVLGVESIPFDFSTFNKDVIYKFQELLVCRNAYWKIAGEQMGLDKPWQPEYAALEDNTYFTIQTFNDEIDRSATSHRNAILAFPTIEMRDTFYENFNILIEQCKELL